MHHFWTLGGNGLNLLVAQADGGITSHMEHLGSTPYIVLGFYLLLLLGLGILGWARSRAGEEDYYLAGRGQGWVISSVTIMATFFSSFALLGAPGMVYREGVVFALFSLNVPVAGLCVYLLGSRIWKVGRKFGYVTPGDMVSDYYQNRYTLRILVAITCFLYAIPYVVIQIQAGGIVSEKLFGANTYEFAGIQVGTFEIGATILAMITMIYIMIGGMRSVAWTDLIQGVMLIAGMLVSGAAMLLLFDGPANFGERVVTELPNSSLTSPGTTGVWTWPMVLSVCILGSSGSMVQPAQWMRYYSASSPRTLKRGAMIFAILLTACFILGVMLIGLAGQLLYPIEYTYSAPVVQGPAELPADLPEDVRERLSYVPPTKDAKGNDVPGRLGWTWIGRDRHALAPEQLAAADAALGPQLAGAFDSLQADLLDEHSLLTSENGFFTDKRANKLSANPDPKVDPTGSGNWDSILVVVLNEQLPRVLGKFGALFASLMIVAIMAASMSTADSNLHALSAVMTRDVYDQYVRPGASEGEKVWVGRLIIIAAAMLSLGIVLAKQREMLGNYDFLQMIAMMGLMAIAFASQLLPLTIDMLFLRKGNGYGAAAGLAAGLLVTFFTGKLFDIFIKAVGSPEMLTSVQTWLNGITGLTHVHDSVWGLLVNIPLFIIVSMITRPIPADHKARFVEAMK